MSDLSEYWYSWISYTGYISITPLYIVYNYDHVTTCTQLLLQEFYQYHVQASIYMYTIMNTVNVGTCIYAH